MRRLAPLAFALLLAAAPAKKKPAAAAAPSAWTVQVASTSSRAEAERLVTVLVGRDAPAWWSETVVNGKPMYRVRVGHFHSKEEAKAFADGLAAAWKLDFWIAPDDTPSSSVASAATATPVTPAATPLATAAAK
ncbi:MAG TPA: SPOR domain-containing protein, partial [bacterium]|nr:SPOR domain-containing protein [bacterium]